MKKERKEGLNGVEEGYLRYYLGVGRIDHVSPRDIVGAIAGEANINSSNIGRIKLFDKFPSEGGRQYLTSWNERLFE